MAKWIRLSEPEYEKLKKLNELFDYVYGDSYGTSGTSGENGTSGSSGVSGTSGTSGISTDGTSGSSGTSGISTDGTSGTSGISTDGTSGTSGISTDGTSGTSGAPIELTLAELQALQLTDVPAPTGITITPDAVGSNPHSIYFRLCAFQGYGDRSPYSEVIEVIVGDDTVYGTIDFIPCENSWEFNLYILEAGLINGVFTHTQNVDPIVYPLPSSCQLLFSQMAEGTIESIPIHQITNSLPIGQQYYVTDKNWLLYVDQPTVLKPVKGSLHIFNGETLPDGIEPDVLFIDTGVVDWDISLSTGTPLEINAPIDYNFVSVLVDNSGEDNASFSLQDINSYHFIADDDLEQKKYYFPRFDNVPSGHQYFTSQLFMSIIGTAGKRAILEFHRSELSHPIPVPHIVSAETDETGQYCNITFDCEMSDSVNDYTADATNKINNIEDECVSLEKQPNKIVRFEFDSFSQYGDIVTISIASGNIKNIWGGLLEAVVDYPVVNNVPEPE